MEVKGENYNVWYEPDTAIINFTGTLRLSDMDEYEPISKLLNDVADKEPSTLTLNLQQLNFLNSSGISMLSRFAINLRKKNTIKMIVKGANSIPWQGKSLKNLQRLMPGLMLELE
jgi:hypothetical protein